MSHRRPNSAFALIIIVILTGVAILAGRAQAEPSRASPTVVQPAQSAPPSVRSSGSSSEEPVQATGVSQADQTFGFSTTAPSAQTTEAIRVVIGLTILAILPALLVCGTSFLRIIIVLSMVRHALGMQDTPPNTALIGLALFLTLFTMAPVLQTVNQDALQPFMSGEASMATAYAKGVAPLREFMVRQTHEQDLSLMVELSAAKPPQTMDDISMVQLAPAFILSELRAGFQIGFVIFVPFLLIDLVVVSILMALGMIMMPPSTISLPVKILMFVLVDGWGLLLKALVGSFH
jgi:flagellar biosynthetic protein FliP